MPCTRHTGSRRCQQPWHKRFGGDALIVDCRVVARADAGQHVVQRLAIEPRGARRDERASDRVVERRRDLPRRPALVVTRRHRRRRRRHVGRGAVVAAGGGGRERRRLARLLDVRDLRHRRPDEAHANPRPEPERAERGRAQRARSHARGERDPRVPATRDGGPPRRRRRAVTDPRTHARRRARARVEKRAGVAAAGDCPPRSAPPAPRRPAAILPRRRALPLCLSCAATRRRVVRVAHPHTHTRTRRFRTVVRGGATHTSTANDGSIESASVLRVTASGTGVMFDAKLGVERSIRARSGWRTLVPSVERQPFRQYLASPTGGAGACGAATTCGAATRAWGGVVRA